MALLELQELSVSFGEVRALRNLSMEVEERTIVGLVGANGAGKTTALDAITGFVPSSGAIRFDGREIGRFPAYQRVRLGLTRTWQGGQLSKLLIELAAQAELR